jgi:hypothetical protein
LALSKARYESSDKGVVPNGTSQILNDPSETSKDQFRRAGYTLVD